MFIPNKCAALGDPGLHSPNRPSAYASGFLLDASANADENAQVNRAPLILAIVLLLLPVLYMGSYFALVVPVGIFGETGMGWYYGHYRLSRKFEHIFWPLEQIDRQVRPGAWFDPEIPPARPVETSAWAKFRDVV